MAKEVQRREHFRIEFPASERPRFIVNKQTHAIVDLSEQGAKIHWATSDLPLVGNLISGIVVFSDGTKNDIQGNVLRVTGATVILNLTTGIPYPKMVAEQRRLIRKYKEN